MHQSAHEIDTTQSTPANAAHNVFCIMLVQKHVAYSWQHRAHQALHSDHAQRARLAAN
jgi:hypothetical protein